MRTITIEVENWKVYKYCGPADDPWEAYEAGNFEDENLWEVVRENLEDWAEAFWWEHKLMRADEDAPDGTYAVGHTTEKLEVLPGDDRYDSYEDEKEYSWYHR